ncbi:hydrogenase maturation peptidase HycI [Candidatus Bathyarchaeota archaeon]|nr:MAG: hydrogenase maturation peptidase HycI [Candidatus Bathyarchaeota archaeon]
MKEILRKLLANRRRVIVLGVGNTLRRDDGFGVYVASSLKRFKLRDVLILEAGASPENVLDDILGFNPSHLVVVDSVEMERRPGDLVVAGLESIADEITVSTHRLPMTLLVKYLRLMGFKGRVVVVGVQPGDLSFGEGLTPRVREAADMVVDVLRNVLSNEAHG